jgi:hypothetical protein
MRSFDEQYKEEIGYIINNEFPWYIKTLEDCFDFKRWGFQMIYSGPVPNTHPTIVYESKICRVRFIWEVRNDERVRSETARILYGRLHAPIFQSVMDWNGEKCHCWHNVDKALSFLDGLTPQEAKNTRSPVFMWDFYEANKNRGWRDAEREARMQAAVWEHYGQKLFNIFDLNRLDLWEQYVDFINGYYSLSKIKRVGNSENPPLYKIC